MVMNWELKSKIVKKVGSQANFAQKLKINEPIISRVIHGRHILSETEKKRWCKTLGCSVKDAFEE